MRTSKSTIAYILFAVFCIISCKKSGSDADNIPIHTPTGFLDYEYNGEKYHEDLNSNWGLSLIGTTLIGLLFTNADLFDGEVNFFIPDCAFLNTGMTPIQNGPDCMLTNQNGSSIDSSVVFIYESGSLNSSVSNCHRARSYDPITGQNLYYDVCDLDGSFSLTLVNNKGEKIEIKNGSFGKSILK